MGTFDGVHRGHGLLLEKTVQNCPQGGSSCVFTFDLPPEQYFQGRPRLITSFDCKLELIFKAGIEEAAWLPFSPQLASLEPDQFIQEILVKQLQAKHLLCGFNYRYGRQRSGDVELLKERGARFGFAVTVIPPVKDAQGETISSTAIRTLIAGGFLERAAQYLGYYPFLRGKVVSGKGRGRKLGFPTANLAIEAPLVLPPEGVYLAWGIPAGGKSGPALVSVGKNPTFSGTSQTIEAFLLDFEGDLYGQILEVQLLLRLRAIIRHPSARELRQQIGEDLKQARALLKRYHLQDGRIVLR